MGKTSGVTRASASHSPRGLTSGFPEGVINQAADNLRASIEARQSAEDELRNNADNAIKAINKMKSPKFGQPTSLELPGGYIAEIKMLRPAYGSGGLIESEIWTPQGDRVGGIANHRERFGSNGMATFGTKAEALRSVKDSMTSWIRVRFKGARY